MNLETYTALSRCSELVGRLERERKTAAETLRNETAQTLGLVLMKLAALNRSDDLSEVRAGLNELRRAVRPELERVLELTSALTGRAETMRAPAVDAGE